MEEYETFIKEHMQKGDLNMHGRVTADSSPSGNVSIGYGELVPQGKDSPLLEIGEDGQVVEGGADITDVIVDSGVNSNISQPDMDLLLQHYPNAMSTSNLTMTYIRYTDSRGKDTVIGFSEDESNINVASLI